MSRLCSGESLNLPILVEAHEHICGQTVRVRRGMWKQRGLQGGAQCGQDLCSLEGDLMKGPRFHGLL